MHVRAEVKRVIGDVIRGVQGTFSLTRMRPLIAGASVAAMMLASAPTNATPVTETFDGMADQSFTFPNVEIVTPTGLSLIRTLGAATHLDDTLPGIVGQNGPGDKFFGVELAFSSTFVRITLPVAITAASLDYAAFYSNVNPGQLSRFTLVASNSDTSQSGDATQDRTAPDGVWHNLTASSDAPFRFLWFIASFSCRDSSCGFSDPFIGLDNISFTPAPEAVAEPTTLALLAVPVGVVLLRKRRARPTVAETA